MLSATLLYTLTNSDEQTRDTAWHIIQYNGLKEERDEGEKERNEGEGGGRGEEGRKRERGKMKEGKLIPITFTLLLHLGNLGMHRLFKAFLHLQTPTLHT